MQVTIEELAAEALKWAKRAEKQYDTAYPGVERANVAAQIGQLYAILASTHVYVSSSLE